MFDLLANIKFCRDSLLSRIVILSPDYLNITVTGNVAWPFHVYSVHLAIEICNALEGKEGRKKGIPDRKSFDPMNKICS